MKLCTAFTTLCFIALVSFSQALDTSRDLTNAAFSLDLFKAAKHLRGSFNSLISNIIDKIPLPKMTGDIDPDVYRSAAEVVMNKGYRFEEHFLETKDGYILTAWRIQKTVTRNYPVLLQHGLLDCSFSWFVNQPNESLSYILADAGYDVWITNNRGNKYSRKHINYTQNKEYKQYWNFSWDEMAKYDVPAHTEFIKNVTGADSVHYIGHSQGTTQWFAHLSTNIEDQIHFKSFVGLGPVMFLENINKYSSFAFRVLQGIIAFTGFENIMSLEGDHDSMLGEVCDRFPKLCEIPIKLITGFTQGENFNSSRMAVIASHEPGGTSLMTISHWIQMFGKSGLPFYDYGKQTNKIIYGHEEPDLYPTDNLKKLKVPLHLSRGTADPFVNEQDYNSLLASLPSDKIETLTIQDWGHLDYIWAVDANVKLYPSVIDFLARADAPAFCGRGRVWEEEEKNKKMA